MHTRGERLLKDIDEPERIFELDIEGAATPEAEVTPRPPEPPSRPASPSLQGPPIPPDLGARLADRIQEHVRRTVEEPLERMFSVDALADRATEHPETITEKLDIEDGSPGAAPEAKQGKRNGTPH